MPNLFVYVLRDIQVSESLIIEQNDVGIVSQKEWANPTSKKVPVFLIPEWQEVEVNKSDLHVFDVSKTGDQFQNKICNVCHKLLPTVNFAKNQNGKDNRSVRRPSCQDCRKHMEGKDLSVAEKRKWAATKPHLIPFECPICKKRTIAGVTSKVVLDHNHKTGEAREWICDSCNTGIGRFKDSSRATKNPEGTLFQITGQTFYVEKQTLG